MILAKLLLAPAFVVAVSLAARRWGPAVGGLLGGFPVVAGPILFVIALVHGTDFGSAAASGTLLGLCALTVFVVVYGRLAPRRPPFLCVLAGWAGFLAAVALLDELHPPALVGFAMAGTSFLIGLRLLPAPAEAPLAVHERPGWDLPARAIAAMALVLLITGISGSLGPGLSGLLAPFPIVTSVLAVFTHTHEGPWATRVLLRSFLVGFYAFASFCFVLAVGLEPLGTAAAFTAATAAAILVQGAILAARVLVRARPAAEGA